MSDQALTEITEAHLRAIALCLDNRLHMPALLLIYCGIDIMASLVRPASKAKADRHDFIAWAENRMDCQNRLQVTGADLYGARCAVAHTYTMDSDVSARREARRILYAWGDRRADEASALLASLGQPEAVVRVEDLFDAFRLGINHFANELGENEALSDLLLTRTGKLFAYRSTFP